MPGVVPFAENGPVSYQVSSQAANVPGISGGMLVAKDTVANSGLIVPAPAGAAGATACKICIGVALNDASVRPIQTGSPLDLSQQPDWVSVAYGVDIRVTYETVADLGDLLCVGVTHAGQVRKYVSATDTFDAIVGRCTEPTGVTVPGSVARARIAGAI